MQCDRKSKSPFQPTATEFDDRFLDLGVDPAGFAFTGWLTWSLTLLLTLSLETSPRCVLFYRCNLQSTLPTLPPNPQPRGFDCTITKPLPNTEIINSDPRSPHIAGQQYCNMRRSQREPTSIWFLFWEHHSMQVLSLVSNIYITDTFSAITIFTNVIISWPPRWSDACFVMHSPSSFTSKTMSYPPTPRAAKKIWFYNISLNMLNVRGWETKQSLKTRLFEGTQISSRLGRAPSRPVDTDS